MIITSIYRHVNKRSFESVKLSVSQKYTIFIAIVRCRNFNHPCINKRKKSFIAFSKYILDNKRDNLHLFIHFIFIFKSRSKWLKYIN